MPKKGEAITLTEGSEYRIKSLEARDKPMETIGFFKGYAAIAHDTAMVMEIESPVGEHKSMLRLIPSHMVISIDVLKAGEEKKEKGPEGDPIYFG
ncbi:MAG: hypothetical protein OEM29_02935 [Thermoplasmata archaeon]|nr:hypothetical protein [Thermoplasmata archaeon]